MFGVRTISFKFTHIRTILNYVNCLLNEKKALKNFVQGPGVQKGFRLSSHTLG